MLKIRLYDNEFAHIPSYCGYDAPQYIEWDRSGEHQDVSVFTEGCLDLVDGCDSKVKIAWLIEPEAVHPKGYADMAKGLWKKFDYVMSHNRPLVDSVPNWIFFPSGGSWVWRRDWSMYGKDLNVSIVASTKNWTEGHMLRQLVIKELGDKFDLVCGYGRNTVEPKLDIFKRYRFTVVIENSKVPHYWTDKLIDVFAAGTVPIWWGDKSIEKHFNIDGILAWETIDDLSKILDEVRSSGESLYSRMLPAVGDNFSRAKEFCVVEDYLYKTFFKRFETEGA